MFKGWQEIMPPSLFLFEQPDSGTLEWWPAIHGLHRRNRNTVVWKPWKIKKKKKKKLPEEDFLLKAVGFDPPVDWYAN